MTERLPGTSSLAARAWRAPGPGQSRKLPIPPPSGPVSTAFAWYQRTHPLFPQELTSAKSCDEARWEGSRILGDHSGSVWFTPPENPSAGWSPSELRAPHPQTAATPAS